jgi:catechol 2,3-dioxygenase-like lactoylglutathione lyase family enzyme
LFRPEHIEEITSRSREELVADSRRPCGKRFQRGHFCHRKQRGAVVRPTSHHLGWSPGTGKFYERVLGIRPREERPGKWSLHFGSNKISFQGAQWSPDLAKRTVPGSGNFCVMTDRPIAEVIERLRSNDVEIVEGPAEKAGAVGKILSVYFRDPDSNLVEVSNPL